MSAPAADSHAEPAGLPAPPDDRSAGALSAVGVADATATRPLRGGRNEWLLIVFTAATNMADAITRVALPLLAVQLTSSPGLVALVGVLITLPWLVVTLHVGVLVDRADRRVLMIAAESARSASVGVLLVAVAFDLVTLPLVYVIAVLLGIAQVVALTSGASIVPAAVPRARRQQANARITAMEYLWYGFLGAPVGGFLVAAGLILAFGAAGVVYVLGMVMLALLSGTFAPRPRNASSPRRSVHADIRDGIGFLWSYPLLRTMALLIAVMAGCWSAWLALIPAYALDPGPLGLSPGRYGFLLTCLGAGGVVGTVVVGPVNRVLGRRWSMFVDIAGTSLLVGTPAVLPAAPGSAAAIGAAAFAAGAGGTMWTVNARVITQTLVPDDLLGRFNAASRLVGWGTAPIAAAVGGVLAELVGFRAAFGFFAVLSALLVFPFLRAVTDEALAGVDEA
jgi:MFS family permease